MNTPDTDNSLGSNAPFHYDQPWSSFTDVLRNSISKFAAALACSLAMSAPAYSATTQANNSFTPVPLFHPDNPDLYNIFNGNVSTWDDYMQMDVPEAWQVLHKQKNTRKIICAIVDSGVTPLPDLSKYMIRGYNAVNGTRSTNDNDGHGTMMADLMDATPTNNTTGITGTGDGHCKIEAIKDTVSDAQGNTVPDGNAVAPAISWAVAHGAKIINLSMQNPNNIQGALASEAAISQAEANNASVIIAAGNAVYGVPMSNLLAQYNPEAIRVAAVDSSNNLWSYSYFSDSLADIAAPDHVVAQTNTGKLNNNAEGTSTATATISGVVVLLYAENPTLTPEQAKALLMSTGQPEPGLVGKVACGCVVDADAALLADHTLYLQSQTAASSSSTLSKTEKVNYTRSKG